MRSSQAILCRQLQDEWPPVRAAAALDCLSSRLEPESLSTIAGLVTHNALDTDEYFHSRMASISAIAAIAKQAPDDLRTTISASLLQLIGDNISQISLHTLDCTDQRDCPKSTLQECLLTFAKQNNKMGMYCSLQLVSRHFATDPAFAPTLLRCCIAYPEFTALLVADVVEKVTDANRESVLEAIDDLTLTLENPRLLIGYKSIIEGKALKPRTNTSKAAKRLSENMRFDLSFDSLVDKLGVYAALSQANERGLLRAGLGTVADMYHCGKLRRDEFQQALPWVEKALAEGTILEKTQIISSLFFRDLKTELALTPLKNVLENIAASEDNVELVANAKAAWKCLKYARVQEK